MIEQAIEEELMDAVEELDRELEDAIMEELDPVTDDNDSDSSDSSYSSISSASTSSLNAEMESLEIELEESMVLGLASLERHRYLELRTPIPKDLSFANEILPNLAPDRFQQFFRMSRSSFLHIHARIEDHPIFHNDSKNPQVASSKQLAVCLRRLACESSSAG